MTETTTETNREKALSPVGDEKQSQKTVTDVDLELPSDVRQPLSKKEVSIWALINVMNLPPKQSGLTTHGFILGTWANSVTKIHKNNMTSCTAAHLNAFKIWWSDKYENLPLP